MRNIIVLFMAVALFLVSCSPNDNPTDAETPFAGGANGLSLAFVRGAPPDEIFDDGQFPFSITLFLENLGEYTVPDNEGYIEITGIDPAAFVKPSQDDLRQDIPEEI